MPTEDKVKIRGQDAQVSVSQRSKTVWVASGEYMGLQIEVTGTTRTQAISHWRDAARYRTG